MQPLWLPFGELPPGQVLQPVALSVVLTVPPGQVVQARSVVLSGELLTYVPGEHVDQSMHAVEGSLSSSQVPEVQFAG